jgi:acyl-CoA hydrolase
MAPSTAARIAAHLRPGMRLAIADGAGAPVHLAADVAEAAAAVGDISLVLGWCFEPPVDLGVGAFTDVRAIMGGFGLREAVNRGQVRYVPERLSAVPALLAGPLRPDVLLISLPRGGGGWDWGTEVSWMPSVVEGGATLLIDENEVLPATSGEPGPRLDRGIVVSRSAQCPQVFPDALAGETERRIARRVAAFIPEGAQLQYGPGPIAHALCQQLAVPVRIRSGIITPAVLELDRRGLLIDAPVGTYLAGSPELYRWADGRRVTARLESTHDLSRGQAPDGFIAVNTALQIDLSGQVNVERSPGRHVSGIGGHADFAAIGHTSRSGLSIIALPTSRGGRSTLVERLDPAASTARTDVDIVVTELGPADLRGLDDEERAECLRAIWP